MSVRSNHPAIDPRRLGHTATALDVELFFGLFSSLMHRYGQRRGGLRADRMMGPLQIRGSEGGLWLTCRRFDDLATYGNHPDYDISVSTSEDPDGCALRLSFGWIYPGPALECHVWQPALREGWGTEAPQIWELLDFLHMATAACGSNMKVLQPRSRIARALNSLGCHRVPRFLR